MCVWVSVCGCGGLEKFLTTKRKKDEKKQSYLSDCWLHAFLWEGEESKNEDRASHACLFLTWAFRIQLEFLNKTQATLNSLVLTALNPMNHGPSLLPPWISAQFISAGKQNVGSDDLFCLFCEINPLKLCMLP